MSAPITRILPNFITLLSMCIALLGLRFAMSGQMEIAVISILIAAVLDGMDGSLARFLNSTSEFGAVLDSLADFLNFGAIPGMIMYFWKLKEVKVVGWTITMVYIICMALRLARFNSSAGPLRPFEKFFFSGMPAPVAALVYIAPIMLTFEYSLDFPVFTNFINLSLPAYTSFISFMVISTIPTISFKYLKIPRPLIHLFTAFMAILMVLFVTRPWIVCPILGIIYLSSIPFSAFAHFYASRKYDLETRDHETP